MWHNGYFMSSAATVLIRRPGRQPLPSIVIRHVQWPWEQARRPLGWSVCPLNTPSSLPGANVWSPENLHHQPVSDLFQSWLALSLARQERLSPSSTRASQPYMACKLTVPPWNGFLQQGILKHDHEHVPYFPAKNCSRSSSTWYGSLFLNRTYCMVPRWNWAKLRGLTLSLSDFILVLCGRILPDFSSTGHLLENHSQGPRRQTTIFSAILHGALDRADDAWTLLQIWLTFYSMDFEKTSSKFVSTTLSDGFGLHDLECFMTFLQNLSAVATYLYSSWLKYCNDALLQNLPSLEAPWRVRSPVGYRVPALYRLLHFTHGTPATYSRTYHSRTLHVFNPALPHFTNTHRTTPK